MRCTSRAEPNCPGWAWPRCRSRRRGGPGWRVTSLKRIRRLVELLGEPPAGARAGLADGHAEAGREGAVEYGPRRVRPSTTEDRNQHETWSGRGRQGREDGHQAGDRRVAGQGEDDRRLPRRRATSSRPRSATSATCPATPPTSRPSTRASLGPARRRHRARLRAALRRQPRPQGSRSPSSRRWSRTPTSSTSPRMRTARARRSPGTWCRRSSRRSRCAGWCSTRSRPARSPRRSPSRARSTSTSSTRRRPAASSTGSTATRSARCCGRRCCPSCRPAGCSRWPPASSSSANGPGWRSTPPSTGTSRARSRRPSPKPGDPETFTATLVALDDIRIATGRDFDAATGRRRRRRAAPGRGRRARPGRPARGPAVRGPPASRRSRTGAGPYPPFMTSTLQQEAGRKLRWSSAVTMRVAQRLYENGYITYMRTDSTKLSETALAAARVAGPRAVRRRVRAGRGRAPTPARSRTRRRRTRRSGPAGDTFRTPGEVANQLSQRRVPALRADLAAHARLADGRRRRHHGVGAASPASRWPRSGPSSATSGRTITFPGFLRAYVEDTDDAGREGRRREAAAATGARATRWTRASFEADGHTTSPPARYTEPSLVKAMEELGVGRPVDVRLDHADHPGPRLRLEEGPGAGPVVDGVRGGRAARVATSPGSSTTASPPRSRTTSTTSPSGERSRVEWLQRFYFGAEDADRLAAHLGPGRAEAADRRPAGADRRARRELDPARRHRRGRARRPVRAVPAARRPPRSDRASIPEDLRAGRADAREGRGAAVGAVGRPRARRATADGREVTAKSGRYGPYVTDGEKSASLFKSMSLGHDHPGRGACGC